MPIDVLQLSNQLARWVSGRFRPQCNQNRHELQPSVQLSSISDLPLSLPRILRAERRRKRNLSHSVKPKSLLINVDFFREVPGNESDDSEIRSIASADEYIESPSSMSSAQKEPQDSSKEVAGAGSGGNVGKEHLSTTAVGSDVGLQTESDHGKDVEVEVEVDDAQVGVDVDSRQYRTGGARKGKQRGLSTKEKLAVVSYFVDGDPEKRLSKRELQEMFPYLDAPKYKSIKNWVTKELRPSLRGEQALSVMDFGSLGLTQEEKAVISEYYGTNPKKRLKWAHLEAIMPGLTDEKWKSVKWWVSARLRPQLGAQSAQASDQVEPGKETVVKSNYLGKRKRHYGLSEEEKRVFCEHVGRNPGKRLRRADIKARLPGLSDSTWASGKQWVFDVVRPKLRRAVRSAPREEEEVVYTCYV